MGHKKVPAADVVLSRDSQIDEIGDFFLELDKALPKTETESSTALLLLMERT